MRNFLSIWGNNILALNVEIADPTNNVGKLRDLLFDKVPNLKKLKIQFCRKEQDMRWIVMSCSIDLFAYLTKFELPKLEVLCVNSRYRIVRRIIENILEAACNLKTFQQSDLNSMEKNSNRMSYPRRRNGPFR